MQKRFSTILILMTALTCLATLCPLPVQAGLFSDNILVSIDDKNYTDDDFKTWWSFWKEDVENPLSSRTLDEFINWQLLRSEAENIGIADTPGFRRQTRIFVQSRALLILKYEEVDSRINITDADILGRYEDEYLPRWLVVTLEFKSVKAAQEAWQDLADGKLTLEEILERDPAQEDAASQREAWLRPKGIDPGWKRLFEKAELGKVIDPANYGSGPYLKYVKELKGKDEEDLAKWREQIRKDLWKEQETAYTVALLDRLRKEYKLEVDEARLAALDINAPDDTFTDAPIITSTRQNYTEKEFIAVIGRLIKTRPLLSHETVTDSDEVSKLKDEALTNIISQALTNWASLDRHYEEKEPFKTEYDFNYGHRLVLALEEQIAASPPDITQEEIRQYYQDNIVQYTQPLMVKFYIVDETQGPIDKLWADVAVGKKFKPAAEAILERNVDSEYAPAEHLDPKIREVLVRLNDGETSQIFTVQGVRMMVHLVEKTPEGPIPLEKVKNSIRNSLTLQAKTKAYLVYADKLKKKVDINVKKQRWEAILEELGGKK